MRRFFLLLSLALASTAPAFAGCAPAEEDVGESADAINKGQALLFQRLQESIAPLRKVVQNDGTEVGDNFRRFLTDNETTFGASTNLDLVGRVARNTIAALGKQTATRKAMVRSSLAAITRRSDRLKAALKNPDSVLKKYKVDEYDDLVIGMGPQSVAYIQEAAKTAVANGQVPRRILAVDVGSKPGGTFANVGDAFFLNSTNRADTGVRAAPGRGDLNFLYDLWGVRDFDPRTWPVAGGIGDVSTVGMDISTANALLQTEVVSVARANASGPIRYRVTLRDVNTGEEFTVTTKTVVGATGIGKPVIPIKDAATQKLIAEEAAKRAQSLKVDPDNAYIPGVQTFTDFINYVGQADEPYRWLVGKSVAVAGGGDSANVINEFLMRIGPDGAYKFDSAQTGNVGKVYWLGVSFQDCQQFINQARGRYALLEAALNSGRLVPVPTKIDTITRVRGTGEFRVRGGVLEGSSVKPETMPEGTIYRTSTDAIVGSELNVDYVLLATGFRSDAYKVFEPIIGKVTFEGYGQLLNKIEAAVQGFNGDDAAPVVNIATRLNQERIYFIGPANEVVGGLPEGAELARVNANTVSFFANVARTRTLAQQLDIGDSSLGSLDELFALPKVELGRARVPDEGGAIMSRIDDAFSVPPAVANLETGAEVAKVLENFDLPGGLELTMTFTRTGDGTLTVSIPALTPESETQLALAFSESPRLNQLLFGYLRPESRLNQVEIGMVTNEAGTFGWDIDVLPRVNVR